MSWNKSIRKLSRAFTLIELAVTLGILSIIGSLATVGYLNYAARSKSVEAPLILQELVNLEVEYLKRPRVNPNTGLPLRQCWQTSADYHPIRVAGNPSNVKVAWNAAAILASFTIIGFRPSAPVLFTYGMDGQNPGAGVNIGHVPTGDVDGYCQDGEPIDALVDVANQPFRARAAGDIDEDGTESFFDRVILLNAGAAPAPQPIRIFNEYE